MLRYDPNMNLTDQKYLLKVENREAVVRTLYEKLVERGEYVEIEEYFDNSPPEETELESNMEMGLIQDQQEGSSVDSEFEE